MSLLNFISFPISFFKKFFYLLRNLFKLINTKFFNTNKFQYLTRSKFITTFAVSISNH